MSRDILYDQLVHLGDMIGDGLADEPGGEWIRKEYHNTAKTLGLLKNTRQNNSKQIDDFMSKRIKEFKCSCGSSVKQVRKGSFITLCNNCGKKYKLGKAIK